MPLVSARRSSNSRTTASSPASAAFRSGLDGPRYVGTATDGFAP
jgi:hypothetical protein